MRLWWLFVVAGLLAAEELPVVPKVEPQPLGAQVVRLLEALDGVGDPLPEAQELRQLAGRNDQAAVARMQALLDKHCLAGVEINPESRVKVRQGPVKPELIQLGWRTFLIKVHNEAGVTAVLDINSPNGGTLAGSSRPWLRFLELNPVTRQPLKPHLSGLNLEYRVLQLLAREPGQREGKLRFDIGAGSADLGFRSEIDVLFTIVPATKVKLELLDENGQPVTASLLVRDRRGRVYPSQGKRLAPDFFFQPQIYRASGEELPLPPGEYTVEVGRGPEYLAQRHTLKVGQEPVAFRAQLRRWIDPARFGWYSGDHHIHAAGCSHYEKPTEGVYPQDMMRHILGEDLKVGSVLTWGPGWYFQKTFFEGKDNPLSTPTNRMHYDVEVSGFPSSHTGHIVLLGVKEQDYPGTRRIEDWPSWGLPVLQWGKRQGAVTGFPHTGWGLNVKGKAVPSFEMPPFDGVGANEYIVSVTHDAVDFISAMDTPYPWELSIWYHTLNAGYRTRLSGETDFPCITDGKVGQGRSYVRQDGPLAYEDWIKGIREGRAYASDGRSHLMNFAVNGLAVGTKGSELALAKPGRIEVTAQVAALLDEQPDATLQNLPADEKPYWHVERARIGQSRHVPVELIVNGEAVAKQEIAADGTLVPVRFAHTLTKSGWVALRILPSSHTNPVFVTVAGQPIREAKSLEWCLKAVDQCWTQKKGQIRLEEQGAAAEAYEHARREYRRRLAEVK